MGLRDGSKVGVWAMPGINPAWKARDAWLEKTINELNRYP